MSDYYLQYIESRSTDYIAHHGVEGMHWGKKNGPPYPLQGDGKAALKKQRAEARKANALAKKKVNISKRPDKIQNNLDLYTVDELKELANKYEALSGIKKGPTQQELYARSKMAKVMIMGNDIANFANNVLSAAGNGVSLYKKLTDGSDEKKYNLERKEKESKMKKEAAEIQKILSEANKNNAQAEQSRKGNDPTSGYDYDDKVRMVELFKTVNKDKNNSNSALALPSQ